MWECWWNMIWLEHKWPGQFSLADATDLLVAGRNVVEMMRMIGSPWTHFPLAIYGHYSIYVCIYIYIDAYVYILCMPYCYCGYWQIRKVCVASVPFSTEPDTRHKVPGSCLFLIKNGPSFLCKTRQSFILNKHSMPKTHVFDGYLSLSL